MNKKMQSNKPIRIDLSKGNHTPITVSRLEYDAEGNLVVITEEYPKSSGVDHE